MKTTDANPVRRRLHLAAWSLGSIPLLVAVGLLVYACTADEREATDRFIAHARTTGEPLHPLDTGDPADAAATIRELARSTGFTLLYHESRNNPYFTRACILGRLSLPDGGRWLHVALEVSEGEWRVRDASFGRRCRKDLRLR